MKRLVLDEHQRIALRFILKEVSQFIGTVKSKFARQLQEQIEMLPPRGDSRPEPADLVKEVLEKLK